MAFGGREICVLVLHSAGPDSYLTLLLLVRWHLEEGSYVYLITFYWTRHLFNTTLIGPMALGGRELCVLILHSVGPDSY